MRKCINCTWQGEDILRRPYYCPNCGDCTEEDLPVIVPKVEPKIDYDLNNDGKVDKKDVSLMAKGLRKLGGKKKSKKR